MNSNNLDKELLEDLLDQFPTEEPGTGYFSTITQIKSTILEALKAEMPNKIDNTKDIRAIWDDTDFAVDWRLGYNRAIDDCLEVCNKLLGDSNE